MAEKFCKLLENAITDEKEAIEGYQKFSEGEFLLNPLQSDLVFNAIIKPIITDEEKHIEILKELKQVICK